MKELEKRAYHKRVREFKAWCREHQVAYYTFSDAPSDSICALSLDEYAENTKRENLSEDYESYFLFEEAYEEWVENEVL